MFVLSGDFGSLLALALGSGEGESEGTGGEVLGPGWVVSILDIFGGYENGDQSQDEIQVEVEVEA